MKVLDKSENQSNEDNNVDILNSGSQTNSVHYDSSLIVVEKNSEQNVDDLITSTDEDEDSEADQIYILPNSLDEINDDNKGVASVTPFYKASYSQLEDIITHSKSSDALITQILQKFGLSVEDLYSIVLNDERKWVCPIPDCSRLFPRLIVLKTHILQHYRYKPFKCDVENCKWAFYTAFKLKRHKDTHSNNKTFPCNEEGCTKSFTTVYNLKVHQKLHARPKLCKCTVPDCQEVFCTKRDLEKHLKNHDPKYAPYKCPLDWCGNAYFSFSALSSHSRSHQYKHDELKCKWPKCGKIFDLPCRLKAHVRQHTGDRPYECQFENCTASFTTSSKLRRHERTHVNDRRFPCQNEFCDRKFFRKDHLTSHLKKCRAVDRVQCPKDGCELSFATDGSLQKHIANVHEVKKPNTKRVINIPKPKRSTLPNQKDGKIVKASISVKYISTANMKDDDANSMIDYSELTKFYNGITYDNGVSIKIADDTEEKGSLDNKDQDEIIEKKHDEEHEVVPLPIEHLQELMNLKNCVLSIGENGVLSVTQRESHDTEVLQLPIDQNNLPENSILPEQIVPTTTDKFCARILTKDEIRSFKRPHLSSSNKVLNQEPVVEPQEDTVNNNSQTTNNHQIYDISNFDQYLTLVSQNMSPIGQIQQIKDGNGSNYLIQEYQETVMDDDGLGWKYNKHPGESNDGFAFGPPKPQDQQNRTNSLMQYELIESFNENANEEMVDLLSMENLNDNFYEAAERNLTATNFKDKNDI
ncbi:uncharacterized protein LOC113363177 isoform X2 [Ctenocephalides felis]|uniref:uncharacterized protein LOC113363177 isoform X2 n=1 Tax=Ctenocephalides felis TaxID=7515 RepID=UPI000E6E3A87|nr:uncharacterized protein LOC113363177 isoform X2 [Ctenocephalides felis]